MINTEILFYVDKIKDLHQGLITVKEGDPENDLLIRLAADKLLEVYALLFVACGAQA